MTPINQRLEQIEQRLNTLPGAKPKRHWTLPASTPPEQVPEGYQQLEDGSWLSPEAYQSILRQSQRYLRVCFANAALGLTTVEGFSIRLTPAVFLSNVKHKLRRAPSFEQPTVTHYVDELNQDNETNGVNPHEDKFSAASSAVEKSTREELQEIYQQLRQLPCTPAFKLNSQIQNIVAKYWRNVPTGRSPMLKKRFGRGKKLIHPKLCLLKPAKKEENLTIGVNLKSTTPNPPQNNWNGLLQQSLGGRFWTCTSNPMACGWQTLGKL